MLRALRAHVPVWALAAIGLGVVANAVLLPIALTGGLDEPSAVGTVAAPPDHEPEVSGPFQEPAPTPDVGGPAPVTGSAFAGVQVQSVPNTPAATRGQTPGVRAAEAAVAGTSARGSTGPAGGAATQPAGTSTPPPGTTTTPPPT